MGNELTVGEKINGIHIKLLDKTLQKAFSDSETKSYTLLLKEVDAGEDETHFSVDLEVLGVDEQPPAPEDTVLLDDLTAYQLHFDYDLATFLGRTVEVITSSATRLFNALFVPFIGIECLIAPKDDGWRIVLTRIVEREDERDPSDFEEIKF